MLKIGKKEKTWLAAIGATIFIVIAFIIVLSPLIDKSVKLQDRIKETELDVKEGLTIQAKKGQILKEYEKYKEYLKKEDLSQHETQDRFLKEIENIVSESAVSVVNLSSSDITESDNYILYTADFKSEGNVEEILAFFDLIEKSDLLIIIEDLNIAPKDEAANRIQLDAKICMYRPQIKP